MATGRSVATFAMLTLTAGGCQPETTEERVPDVSALGASGLALGARVEIECIATVD